MKSSTKCDTKELRQALGTFTTGVTIVTTQSAEGLDIGLTVNSFSSVSLDPPMVLWSLAHSAHSREAVLQAEGFAVHILAADQSSLSDKFARKGADKFAGLLVERGEGGLPLLHGCSARFQCKTVFRYDGGDHDILVGEVVSFEHFNRPPLVFQGGRYVTALENHDSDSNSKQSDEEQDRLGPTSLSYLLGRVFYQLHLGIRPALAVENLSEREYHILLSLALYGSDTVANVIDHISSVTGGKLDMSDFEKLSQIGLIEFDRNGGGKDAIAQITKEGQGVLVRIAAKVQAVESAAVIDVSYAETQFLKQVLRKIMNRARLPGMEADSKLESGRLIDSD